MALTLKKDAVPDDPFDAVLGPRPIAGQCVHDQRARGCGPAGAVVVASLNRLDVRVDPTTGTLIYAVDRSNGSISVFGLRRPDAPGNVVSCSRIYTSQ